MSGSTSRPRVLLYSDGNINLIDGSTIWLVSMAQVLARAGADVVMVLKAVPTSRRMLAAVDDVPAVTVVPPPRGAGSGPGGLLTVDEAVDVMVDLDRERAFDVVVARGRDVITSLARTGRFDGRLWSYLIDVPHAEVRPDAHELAELEDLALASDRMLVQTEDARSYLEFRVPASVGRCLVVLPMVPDDVRPLEPAPRRPAGTLDAVYAGKFARAWRTLEMCDLPRLLRATGVDLRVTMIGDKIMKAHDAPAWRGDMTSALTRTPGVTWAGGMAREDALAFSRTADVGLSWRAAELDATHEISTKVLEYCAMGVPPVLNRIRAHVDLLGEDYPLFVDDGVASVVAALERVARDRDLLVDARASVVDAVAEYRMAAAAERLRAALAEALAGRRDGSVPRAAVVGADLRQHAHLHRALRHAVVGAAEVPAAGEAVELPECDVVVAAGARAVEPALAARGDRPVVVYLPDDDVPAAEAVANAGVARVVVPSPARRTPLTALGVPEDRIAVVPLGVDVAYHDRPGDDLRRLRVGLLAPTAAEADRAVGVLERLLAADERFSLHVRGPRDAEVTDPAGSDPAGTAEPTWRPDPGTEASAAVAVDRLTDDLPGWYRTIGWLVHLSPTTTRPADDVAAAAAGVLVRAPRGADDDEDLRPAGRFADLDELVAEVVALAADPAAYAAASDAARESARRWDLALARPLWDDVLRTVTG